MPNKDIIQITTADETAKQIHRLYLKAIREILANIKGITIDQNIPFEIKNYPQLEQLINKKLNQLTAESAIVINQATEKQWNEAYEKNFKIAEPYLNRKLLTEPQRLAYLNRNLESLASFQTRKINGLRLSDKVWKYSNQFKGEIEMGIDVALKEGMSSDRLSRLIRGYLQEPAQLFRRVRDKHGNLHLSKMAKKYYPGSGAYRSSYKNAMRLARTEVNMAYRASDFEKYQQFDFVLGFTVKRSNKTFGCSVCEPLKGDYPKEFKFVGWHPQCRCYTVPILNKIDDFVKQQEALLKGEKYQQKQLRSLPNNFKKWHSDNLERIKSAKSLPYFLTDNKKLMKSINNN